MTTRNSTRTSSQDPVALAIEYFAWTRREAQEIVDLLTERFRYTCRQVCTFLRHQYELAIGKRVNKLQQRVHRIEAWAGLPFEQIPERKLHRKLRSITRAAGVGWCKAPLRFFSAGAC